MQQHPHHHSSDPLHLFEGEDERRDVPRLSETARFWRFPAAFRMPTPTMSEMRYISNAQTGNVVLMSQHLMAGEWMSGLRYLLSADIFCLRRLGSGKDPGKIPVCEEASLAAGYPSGRDRSSFYRRFRAERTGYAGHDPGVLCLCHAGAEFPEGSRLFLCQYDVYRKPEERHGGHVLLFPRAQDWKISGKLSITSASLSFLQWEPVLAEIFPSIMASG